MFNDEFMPYAIIVSLFQLQHWALERFDAVTAAMQSFSLLQCWESVCTLQPGTISSNPEQFSAESSQKYSRAPGCHWSVKVCTGIGGWPSKQLSRAARANVVFLDWAALSANSIITSEQNSSKPIRWTIIWKNVSGSAFPTRKGQRSIGQSRVRN